METTLLEDGFFTLLDDPDELGLLVPKKLANAESFAGCLDDELLELELLGFL